MATTLRILEGPGKGTEFLVGLGDTIIGRGAKAQVKVASPDASWEHAIITRAGEDWMIENLSAHGTFLNDQKISGRTRLRPRDKIRITDDTVLRFDSTEGPQANVLGSPWILRGVGIAIALLIIAWGVSVALRKPVPAPNNRYAYESLTRWVAAEVDARRMNPDALALLTSARNQELAAEAAYDGTDKSLLAFKTAAQRYQKLLLLIDGLEDKYHCMENAAKMPGVLAEKLLYTNSADSMSPDEYSAAFKEFVKNKLDYCNNRAGIK